jgi:predicted amidohydrolase YtcJ
MRVTRGMVGVFGSGVTAALAGAVLLALPATWGCAAGGEEPADLVLVHGRIVTVDADLPEAQALAARGDRIVAVGTDAEIEPLIGPDTEVIDLAGMLAIPGLIEGHGHYMSLGQELTQIDLRFASDWDEIVDMIAAAVIDTEPGVWVVGRGWHQDKWERPPSPSVEGLPLHHGLSEISPDNPVLLEHTSGHGIFVNALALELGGISRDTPDSEGGEIVRDARGEPIGMLRETASGPVEAAYSRSRAGRPPEVVDAERREWVRLAAENAIENGITSFQDMGSTFETLDLLIQMADEGNLPVRLYMSIQETAEELEGRLAEYRMVGRGNGYLTIRTIGEKVLDGALGVHGGWLLEPYSDLPRSVGFNVTPVPDIERSAELALEHDYQMAIQGIGDRAVRVLLDIFEASYEEAASQAEAGVEVPRSTDFRWRIEHAQVIHPDDLARFVESEIIPSVQGIFACSDGIWVEERLGPERTLERGYLYRTLYDMGALVLNGTDPPVELIDPIASFDCTVTRRLPDGSFFMPEQSLTREQALRSYTINNAYAAFEEDLKGTLTPGKYADITVLTKDILTIPDDELPSAEVAYTIIGGEVKYRR